MKPNNPKGDDALLGKVLHSWHPKSALPPSFREQVWRRIQGEETAPSPLATLAHLLANWLATHLPRPAMATAYAVVLLIVGASAGWSQARQERIRITNELGARYAQAVDPYQSTP